MASAGTVTVDFAAETAKFTAELQKVRKDVASIKDQVSSANATLQNFGKAFTGALAITGIATAIHAVVAATEEAQAAVSLLNNALGSTNANVPAASAQLQAYATELQRTTTFSDEAVMGVEALLLSFNGLSGQTIQRATLSVLDLSTRMGIEAPAAAKLLGKALSDPEQGMTALTRAGVLFTAQQKAQIKAFVDNGQAAKAQGVILDELGRRFGGAAVAARDTLGGALKGLSNSFGDLLEGNSGMPKAVESVNALSAAFADPKLKESADKAIGAVAVSVAAIVKSFAAAIGFTDKLAQSFAHLAVPTSGLDAAQALTQELQREQIELQSMQRESYAHTQKEIEQQAAYIETLRKRIELAKEAQTIPPDRALELSLQQPKPSNALNFKTGNGEAEITKAEKDYNEFQKKAALDRLRGIDAGDVALNIYKDQEQERLTFESNINQQLMDSRIQSERETEAESQRIAQDDIRAYIDHAEYIFEVERDLQDRIKGLREGAVSAGVGLLQVLSTKSKAAAKALILVNRGLMIAQAIQNTAAAATKAIAIYGPTPAGFAAAAAAETYGAVQVGLIAATGLLEISQVSAGNGTAVVGPGTVNNPLVTTNNDGTTGSGAQERPSVQFFINGFIGREHVDAIITALKDEIGARDVVIIPKNSRQADELRDGP